MQFDRFDVCEAWYLYLNAYHSGQNSREYVRLSRLTHIFKPRPSLNGPSDLSENGLEIYLKLVGCELRLVDDAGEGFPIFEMWAGAYGDTKALVRAHSFEDAFDAFSEWLDDNAPGCLTRIDYDEAARELGFESFAAAGEDEQSEIVQQAESDLTIIGHTSLKNGDAIPSWEWGGHEWQG